MKRPSSPPRRGRALALLGLVLALAAPRIARADDAGAPFEPVEEKNPYEIEAYVETHYQWNFNRPSNRITHLRGFDNRHNTFTLTNLALGGSFDARGAFGRVMLQVGHTPSTYYLKEPSFPGASGTNATSAEVFKYVQEAYAGYRFAKVDGLSVAAGIFLSPVGLETLAIHSSDQWSRSNLFFALPIYHTGVKLSYALSDMIVATLAAYNGWNSVVDDNDGKSIAFDVQLMPLDAIAIAFVYFTGIERPTGAPEGQHWRHLFDLQMLAEAHRRLHFGLHFDGGVEPTRFGSSGWVASALYARVTILEEVLRFALRGDVFREYVARDGADTATPIFWPTKRLGSLTSTLDYRPHRNVSLRLEHRFDSAASDVFYRRQVMGDGSPGSPYVANARRQNTITLGATAWY